MPFIADLHIHSHYSRATSRDMTPEALWRWARIKGVDVIGTGDFTHPAWFAELQEKTVPLGNGLFALKKDHESDGLPSILRGGVSFILSSEISCIYKKNGAVRKVHCLVLAPGFDEAKGIGKALSKIGNIKADGRPILGLDAKDLLRLVLDVSPRVIFVPAHAWTPHFSVFGAASGFDSLEECFEELTPHVTAIETGLSSDPAMNRMLSALDDIALISNSDAHSPAKIGREATIFDGDPSYDRISKAIETNKGLLGTIEFYPEEGKYHYDGHRACRIRFSPQETIKHGYLCPVCGKKVTVGVLHRVEKLADRKDQGRPKGIVPYHSLIPLAEIIAGMLDVGVASKAVDKVYQRMIEGLGNELSILMKAPLEEIAHQSSEKIAQAVGRVRAGDVVVEPGFDGEYGRVRW